MLDLVDNKVVLDVDILALPEFRAVWDADNSKDKSVATKWIEFIFLFAHPKSPYYNIPESIRGDKIIESAFPEAMRKTSDLKKRKDVQTAIDAYVYYLGLSTLRQVLDVAKQSIETISVTLKNKRTSVDDKLASL